MTADRGPVQHWVIQQDQLGLIQDMDAYHVSAQLLVVHMAVAHVVAGRVAPALTCGFVGWSGALK